MGTEKEAQAKAEKGLDGSAPIAILDIETEEWDTFVIGALLIEDTYDRAAPPIYREYRWTEEEALHRDIANLPKSCVLYAWNGGRYDFLWGLDRPRAEGRKAEIGLAGTRITSIRWGKKEATWKDACALVPLSLEQAASIAGLTITKDTGLSCTCWMRSSSPSAGSRSATSSARRRRVTRPNGCGGYCSIRRRMPEASYRTLGRYLRIDCETALAVVRAVFREAAVSDYDLANTVGGLAYKTARRVCGFDNAEWTPRSYVFARSAYYGGRVEVYRPRAGRVFGCDINSAYPAALWNTPLPTGERIAIHGERARKAFKRGKEGVYVVDAHVPQCFVPPLPVRIGARVIYPIGPVSGCWTRIELQAAIDAGVIVKRWGRALVWQDSETLLRPFVEMAWDRRQEAVTAGNAGLKTWHKFVANSLTGKLAQAPEMERVVMNPDQIVSCPAPPCTYATVDRCRRSLRRNCCTHHCSRRCGAMRPLDGGKRIWSTEIWRIPDCGHVHWAAYLTAAARIELRRQLLADADGTGKTAVYCDTDSVKSTTKRTRRIGDLLGEWGDEGTFSPWRCVAPKVYDDGESLKAKGLPLDDDESEAWDDFAAGREVVRTRGVLSFKSACRADRLFKRKRLVRTSNADGLWFGGRKLASDGRTYPVTIAEFEGRYGDT